MSMIRKYHNHKLQTTPWHREEEPLNHHETPGRQIKTAVWLLEHNIQKCKYIQYGNVEYEYNYKMTNKDGEIISIEEDSEEKDLGILFEKNEI